MCVLRLDMPGMEYLSMVTAMMLLAHSSSCYSLKSGYSASSISMAAGTFQSAQYDSYYEFDSAGDCNLDEANGAIHPTTGEFSYFMTTTYPWVPTYYYGSEGAADLCNAA